MIRICKYCGKEYDGAPGTSCCPECAVTNRRNVIRPRTCRQCGREFPGGPRAWYCPDCRAERQKETERAFRKNGPRRRLGSIDCCEICGREYTVAGSRQRYCPECAPEAVRGVDRAQSIAWYAANANPEARRELRHSTTAEVVCPVCGSAFVPHGNIYCSGACREVAAKRQVAAYEQEHRAERSAQAKARRVQKEAEMTPEEYRAYRETINARARENYRKRKQK